VVPASGQRALTPTGDTTWSMLANGIGGPDEASMSVKCYRTPEAVTDTQPGVSVAVYEGKWPTLPDFSKLKPVQTGSVKMPDLSLARRATDYALVFNGYVDIPRDGMWTFSTTSDDASRLWIGKDLVVDNDGPHGAQERNGTIALAAGRHPVRIGYAQGAGGAELSVRWAGPGVDSQIVPERVWSFKK
jgi:hypothetical protein